ncbi:hypothetical protein FQ707_10915 [Bacteroidaceae bacterium HV4-6-C5C]|nr:hypothetical protein FQ707_10915 [Bacteroidaceae bacterium HV4-6-C5C]
MLRLRQILQMLANGIPQVEICGLVHCSKRTVSGYRKIASQAASWKPFLCLSTLY